MNKDVHYQNSIRKPFSLNPIREFEMKCIFQNLVLSIKRSNGFEHFITVDLIKQFVISNGHVFVTFCWSEYEMFSSFMFRIDIFIQTCAQWLHRSFFEKDALDWVIGKHFWTKLLKNFVNYINYTVCEYFLERFSLSLIVVKIEVLLEL